MVSHQGGLPSEVLLSYLLFVFSGMGFVVVVLEGTGGIPLALYNGVQVCPVVWVFTVMLMCIHCLQTCTGLHSFMLCVDDQVAKKPDKQQEKLLQDEEEEQHGIWDSISRCVCMCVCVCVCVVCVCVCVCVCVLCVYVCLFVCMSVHIHV